MKVVAIDRLLEIKNFRLIKLILKEYPQILARFWIIPGIICKLWAYIFSVKIRKSTKKTDPGSRSSDIPAHKFLVGSFFSSKKENSQRMTALIFHLLNFTKKIINIFFLMSKKELWEVRASERGKRPSVISKLTSTIPRHSVVELTCFCFGRHKIRENVTFLQWSLENQLDLRLSNQF